MRPSSYILRAFLIASIFSGSCRTPTGAAGPASPGGGPGKAVDTGKPPDGPGPQGMEDAFTKPKDGTPEGLVFRLSQGKPEAQPYERLPPTQGTPISAAETEAILKRLPPISAGVDDEQVFAMRERSLPPPKTAKTVKEQFPPPAPPDAPPPGKEKPAPLEVVRFQPQGDVPLAPFVSVTFSQPMVAVTSVEELEKTEPPVKITPRPPGKWRWLGAKTVMFDAHRERFPMATTYTVEVPAGTKSAIGGTLAKAQKFTFQTPPPVAQQMWPQHGPHILEPLLFVGFDQDIDPAAVLATIKVTAGGASFTPRLATQEEIDADRTVSQYVKMSTKGRWVAFKLDRALPKATQVSVQIGPGTPSAEGPRKTDKAQSFGFFTYHPLAITEQHCGYDGCRPLDPWSVGFNNQLDAKKWSRDLVKVEPEVPGMKIDMSGNWLSFRGRTKGRTKYKVTFSADITDMYGQTLGKEQTLVFNVGSARPSLYMNGGELQVLDPLAAGKVSVFSVNHKKFKVRAYAVSPSDWKKYAAYMREWYEYRRRGSLPGRIVVDKTVAIDGPVDELVETRVDLSPAFKKGLGHVIVVIEPTVQPKNQWEWQVFHAWVQSTNLGVDAFVDQSELTTWVTDLATGKPADGVDLAVTPHKLAAKTDKKGLATVALPSSVGATGVGMIVARKGDDSAMLPEYVSWWEGSSSWQKRKNGETLAWYVADDRGMYRPGEEVRVKGYLRRINHDEGGDVGGLGGAVKNVAWQVWDPHGNELTKGTAAVGGAGGFDFAFKLPPTVNLGQCYMRLTASSSGLPGYETYHYVQVQEFRRPEFEVTAQANEGPFFAGEHAIVTVSAKYYAGGGLPGADTHWNVSSMPGYFAPPGHDDYTFGQWIPWWWYGGYGRGGYEDDYGYGGRGGYGYGGPQNYQSFQAKTDGAGDQHLRIDFDSLHPARAMSVRAQASVMDVNRQAWAATANLIVHPAALYVGVKTERLFVNEGEPIHVKAIVADLDGKLVAGRPIAMRAVREDWELKDGQYVTVEEDAQDCLVASKATEKDVAACEFTPKEGGTYKIRTVVKDDKGRKNLTEITVWVAGGDMPPTREISQQKVELVPNKKEYRPGEVAEVLLIAPFAGAEGLVTLRRSGIVKTERITFTGTSYTLKVPIEEAHIPNVYLQVDLVGAAPRVNDVGEIDTTLPKRPAYAMGQLNLPVPPLDRTLSVNIKPEHEKLEPGTETWVTVEVKDAQGRPAPGSEVAIAVVDESVLALSGYRWPDPVGRFYPERGPDTNDYHQRAYVVLANPLDAATNAADTTTATGDGDDLSGGAGVGSGGGGGRGALAEDAAPAPAAPGTKQQAQPKKPARDKGEREMAKNKRAEGGEAEPDDGSAANGQPAIALRTNFDALAFYDAAEPTDKTGRVQVKVKVPDNLTRYRITAIAVYSDKQFGKGEAVITARLPLMVRPSPPRFLNFGDQFELPVVLQNQTDKPISVDVAVRATNAKMKDTVGRRVTVAANDRVEVRFPAAAAKPGIARFQVGAVSGRYADAAEFKLPVWTPATTEAFATYGEIDKGSITQPVKTPGEVWEQFGGLEITTSSTAVAALTDAFLYLYNYPFEYPETLASEVLTVAALEDVLAAFKAEGLPPPDVIKKAIDEDLERLRKLQNWDGGWGTWRVGEPSWPWISVHVGHALARAKDEGWTIEANMWSRSQQYLRNVERYIPSWYGEDARRAIIAYALYVRERMGDPDHARAKKLIAEAGGADKLQLEVCGWLLWVLTGDKDAKAEVEAIRKHLNNRVDETAAYAHFTTSYTDGQYLLLHSDRRADGVILEALIKDSPKSDLIPKVVKGLLAHRKKGRWANVEESAFVLLALKQYFVTYEKVTPDFVARVWLGDQYAGETAYKGRTTEEHLIEVPMKWLVDATAKAKNKTTNLTIQKEGEGRLYYRIGMRYAPRDLNLKPADYGFVVLREYEGADDPDDVKRDADGTWRIKAGARVRVRLRMVAPSRRYFVALVDPLPAGLEPMNPALAVTGDIPRDQNPRKDLDQNYWWYWSQYWFQHENLRDERVEAFTTLLWEGVYTYSYVARATTPGTFVVPPTKAEEMYNPETFGRSGSDKVIVQ